MTIPTTMHSTTQGTMQGTIPKATRATIMPCLRYRDAPAAIEWLCDTLGFHASLVVRNEDGTVAHAQLKYGNGMIMLGSAFDTEYGRLLKQPSETGMAVTQAAYLVVNDADKVHARVLDAGGEVVLPLQDEEYGARLHVPRSGRPHLEHRHLRPVGRRGARAMSTDEAAIRALVESWCEAAREGDVAAILELMTEDALFLVPGAAPMQGRRAFEQGFRAAVAAFTIDSKAEVLEVEVCGTLGWCRTQLNVTMVPRSGGALVRHAGQVLSVFRKNALGHWQLARDANLIQPD